MKPIISLDFQFPPFTSLENGQTCIFYVVYGFYEGLNQNFERDHQTLLSWILRLYGKDCHKIIIRGLYFAIHRAEIDFIRVFA